MSRKRSHALVAAGLLVGTMLTSPVAHAAVEYLKAIPSTQKFYVNDQAVEVEAYTIEGYNYVRLADIGSLVGATVVYQASDNSVRITTAPSQQAQATDTVQLPADGSRYEPQAGDRIACDDGSIYTITDVSKWDKSMFASGPVGELPKATCDWDSFPAVALPEAEVRRFQLEAGDYLFIRNLYETRRMQYTIQNLAGSNPETSDNGQLKYGSKGTPAVRIELTIDPALSAQSFWPWRESELERLFKSCPRGTYSMEAWDVFRNGKFLYTEYKIHAI